MTIRSSGRVSAVHWLMNSGWLAQSRRGHRQRGLADPGRAGQARGERQVPGVDHQPARQELAQDGVLADPVLIGGVRGAEMEGHSTDLSGLADRSRGCRRSSSHRDLNLLLASVMGVAAVGSSSRPHSKTRNASAVDSRLEPFETRRRGVGSLPRRLALRILIISSLTRHAGFGESCILRREAVGDRPGHEFSGIASRTMPG